ncbi:MAG: chromosomal replication initiator protein DnaA [Planctomycetota bacterium]|jgi:chromosomal replication initiator protein
MARPDPQLRDAVLAHLRTQHPSMCRHWFDDIEPLDITGGTLRLLVREVVQLRYLQRCCTDEFTAAAQAVTGRLLAVRFIGETDLAEEASASAPPPAEAAETGDEAEDMLLSPDYCFTNFVVGPGNQLAHAAAVAVSRKPGAAYNPLFIHGGVGLGKTHLLQAVCQAAMRANPYLRLHYISCSGFKNQFTEAVQATRMAEFRQRFRTVDLLVIDDIHDLSTRNRTQEEFFHTFNALYQANKQIVLSSDAPPNEIPDLEERLTSRFSCGLVAQIERPCYETRVNIVKSKATLRNLEISEDVASYIAAKIDTNIRELEGALSKLQGLALVHKAPIDLSLAKQAVGEQAAASPSPHPTVQQIIDTVTSFYNVKLTDLLSRRRHKSIALPRQVGMWLARKHTRYSLEEIGGYFGGRDHTTVMHAVRAIDSRRTNDSGLDQDVSRLEERVIAHARGETTSAGA